MINLIEPVFRASLQHLTTVIEEGTQHLFERADLGGDPVDQHVHVERELDLQIRVAEHQVHQHLRIHIFRLRLQNQADVIGGFVTHISQNRDLLGLDQLRDLFDQLGLLHLIGDLGDHDLPGATAQILNLPLTAQAEAAAPGGIGFGDAFARLHNHATGGEIRPRHVVQQGFITGIRRLDQMQAGADQLFDVMRRNIGRHAHGDPCGPVGQKVREGGGQHHRFVERAIVVFAEINGVFIEAFQQRLSRGGHPCLSVTRGSWVIAVNVAEVTLTVDQRVAHVEVLRQTRHGVINRGVPVRVIVAHHVARDLGRLPETPACREFQLAHGVKDSPMHRLQPVTRIRKRPVHNRAECIGEIAFANGPAQRLGHFQLVHIGVVGHVSHRCCVAAQADPDKPCAVEFAACTRRRARFAAPHHLGGKFISRVPMRGKDMVRYLH